MEKPEFTDKELSLIAIALTKVDPTGIIDDAISAKKKLEAYGRELAAEQTEQAAKSAVGED